MGIESAAFRVADARIEIQAGRLTFRGNPDRFFRAQRPGVIQGKFRHLCRHQIRVSQTGERVFRGKASDAAGFCDRLLDRMSGQVRGTRAALFRTEINGDGKSAVALILERLHLSTADHDRQPGTQTGRRFGLRGSLPRGRTQRLPDKLLQIRTGHSEFKCRIVLHGHSEVLRRCECNRAAARSGRSRMVLSRNLVSAITRLEKPDDQNRAGVLRIISHRVGT